MKNANLRHIAPFFSWEESPLFLVSTNSLKLGDFKLGSFKKSLDVHPDVNQEAFNVCRVKCLEKNIGSHNNYKYQLSFSGIKGAFHAEEICLSRPLGKFGSANLILKNLVSDEPVIEFNSTMRIYSLLRFTKLRPIIELLTDIIFINLLRKGYLCLHAASFVINGNAYLLAGYPDTGKTFTTLKIVKAGASFLAEDIVIIDREGLVYGLPFTQTVEKRSPVIGINRLLALFYENLFKMNYSKITPLDLEYVNSHNICATAKLKGVFFLKRGESKIVQKNPSICGLRDLRNNNRMEFTYWRSDLIMAYLYLNDQGGVEQFIDIENKLIGDIFAGVEYFDLFAYDQKGYESLILDHISDTTNRVI